MAAGLGLVIYAAVKPIFKIYIIIGIGFYLAKRNILTVSTCRDISDAIVTAIMPCLIFDKIVTNIVSSDIKNVGVIFFEGTLLFAVGALMALAVFYTCKSPKAWFGGLISVGLFPNISDLPIAYLQTLSETGDLFTSDEGSKGVAYVCIFLASQVFYQFSLGLFRLIQYDFREQLNEKDDEASVHETQELPQIDETMEQNSRTSELLSDSVITETKENENGNNNREEQETQQHDEFLLRHRLEPVTSNPRSSLSSISSATNSTHLARHRSAVNSSNTNYYSLNQQVSRTVDLRLMKSQDIQDVINEYSEFDRLRHNEVKRVVTLTSEIGVEEAAAEPENVKNETGFKKFTRRFFLILRNFRTPNSMSLIISIIVAMAPPLKALFVKTSFYMPSAPDKKPPLSFIMDFTSYVGAASVPLGLLLLGATIARLKIKSMVPGFWKTVIAITACRLIIMPIFGVGLTTGINKAGWYGDDVMVRFVSVLEYGLPNATALVYFTAFYTDPNSPDHLQMDCLALCLIAQYSVLCISLPILVTFTLKVSLGF